MTTEHVILLAVLALVGLWAVYELCRWLGRWLATVFFGDVEGGRK